MRAVVAANRGGPEVLVVDEVPVPVPGPGQVLIRTAVAAVNFADVKRRRGAAPGGGTVRAAFVPGIEVSGTVVECGDGVSTVTVGDRVAAITSGGGYAEYTIAESGVTFRMPAEVPELQAGAFPVVALTAYLALTEMARVRGRESVLVTSAAGGVGSVAVQLSRLLGLDPVIGAAGSAERARSAIDFGASHGIGYSDLLSDVLAITGGSGVNVVLDARGGLVRDEACRALAPLGRIVHYGNSTEEPERFWAPEVQRERLAGVLGFSLRRCREERPDLVRAAAARLVGWLAGNELEVPVETVLPLEMAGRAHALLESRQVTGKVLLRVGEQAGS